MAVTERRPFDVKVREGSLAGYRVGEGPPMLLLHGGPALPYTYLDGLATELDGLADLISYQQRGLRPSSVGGTYSVRGHVEDAVALLDGFAIDRAWIVGHSWGGFLAMAFGAFAPERALGWVAIDTLGIGGDGGMADLGTWLERDLTPEQIAHLETLDVETSPEEDTDIVSQSMPIVWPYYFADPAAAPPSPEFRMNLRGYRETMEDAMAAIEDGSIARALARHQNPGMVIAGAQSGLRRASEESAALTGVDAVVVEGAGHFPWLEVPGSIREPIARFVSAGQRPD